MLSWIVQVLRILLVQAESMCPKNVIEDQLRTCQYVYVFIINCVQYALHAEISIFIHSARGDERCIHGDAGHVTDKMDFIL